MVWQGGLVSITADTGKTGKSPKRGVATGTVSEPLSQEERRYGDGWRWRGFLIFVSSAHCNAPPVRGLIVWPVLRWQREYRGHP